MNKRITSIVLTLCFVLSCFSIGSFTAGAKTVTEESAAASAGTETASANSYGLAENVQDGQILQCWNWSFNAMKDNMKKIADQGFSAVQTSPIQQAKEGTRGKSVGTNWWVFYQPAYFQIDNTGNSALGNKAEFKAMCDEAHKYGIKVIVDAVLNHTGDNGGNNVSPAVDPDLKNDSSCWHDISKSTSNWDNRYDITQHNMGGLPDLNTGNQKVQNKAIDFLKECVDSGADGFRFDGTKHIETPADSDCASQFWPNIINSTTSYAKSTRGITPYYYGEVLDKTGGGQNIVNAYTSFMSITANQVSNDIRGKVNNGDAGGASRSDYRYSDGSAPAGSKTVLWNESHDTYANEGSGGVSMTNINKTWALVGSRSEACGMYFARPTSTNAQLGEAATNTGWANAEVKALNQFENHFIGQSEYLSSSGSIAYNERGTSGVVLVNCSGSSADVNVRANKMKDGSYVDQVTGNTFTVSGGQIKGKIGSTGIAVVYNAVTKPTATVTPGSQNYKTDTLTLTLNYTNATSGQYSVDGGAYQNFTNGFSFKIGAGLSYDTVTTISVKASDGSTASDPQTYTYTKVDPSKTTGVYFDNSSYGWNAVYAYVYVDKQENSSWPGVQMQKDSNGYYYYEIPEGLENGSVIFTESNTATTNRYPADQQPGLVIGGSSKLLSANYTWQNYSSVDPTKPTSPTQPTTATEPITVPYENVLVGDVNFDGSVNVRDATQVQMTITGEMSFTDKEIAAYDCNQDGKVTVQDATLVQLYSAGDKDCGYVGQYVQIGTKPTDPTQPTEVTEPTSAQDGTVVYFKNSNGWGDVRVHYWSSGDQTTQWPGEPMEKVSGNVYKAVIPSGMTGVIFNGNSGSVQTPDLTVPSVANQIYNYDTGSWSNYGGDEPTVPTDPSEGTLVYFRNSGGWSTVNIHYWGEGGSGTTWPGTTMTPVAGTSDVFSFVVPTGTIGIVFNGNGQTGDLTVPSSGGQIYDYASGSWSSY